jgi:hypothetical protein
MKGKEDSSFSEEKEAKRLLSIGLREPGPAFRRVAWWVTLRSTHPTAYALDWAAYTNLQKFFASFLQKRRVFLTVSA